MLDISIKPATPRSASLLSLKHPPSVLSLPRDTLGWQILKVLWKIQAMTEKPNIIFKAYGPLGKSQVSSWLETRLDKYSLKEPKPTPWRSKEPE